MGRLADGCRKLHSIDIKQPMNFFVEERNNKFHSCMLGTYYNNIGCPPLKQVIYLQVTPAI
jgi:hypothetical protein